MLGKIITEKVITGEVSCENLQDRVPYEMDCQYMAVAIEQARIARNHGEVPVGSVLVVDERIVARAHNRREMDCDPVGHAEMLVIRAAAAERKAWRLCRSTLYVTLEPCVMCMGAAVLARIDRLVFGASDRRAGAAGSVFDISNDPRLNHHLAVTRNVFELECRSLLSEFFRDLRIARKNPKGAPVKY